MAKKMKPGQKRCPSCEALVNGPRTKNCPKCGHEFNGKPAPKVAPAKVAAAKPTKNGGDEPQVNKAQAVRDYLTANTGAGPSAVVAALKKQGIDVAPNYVAAIKSKLNKTSTVKKVATKEPVAEVPAPVVVEKPAKPADTITLDHVKKVAQTVKSLGDLQRATEVLDIIKELGGAKKFKELAEAISATSTDSVPY